MTLRLSLLAAWLVACTGAPAPPLACDQPRLAEGLGFLASKGPADRAGHLVQTLTFACDLPPDVATWLAAWGDPPDAPQVEPTARAAALSTLWPVACPGQAAPPPLPDTGWSTWIAEGLTACAVSDQWMTAEGATSGSGVQAAVIGVWLGRRLAAAKTPTSDAQRVAHLVAGVPDRTGLVIDRRALGPLARRRMRVAIPLGPVPATAPWPRPSCAPTVAVTASESWADGVQRRDLGSWLLEAHTATACPDAPPSVLADASAPWSAVATVLGAVDAAGWAAADLVVLAGPSTDELARTARWRLHSGDGADADAVWHDRGEASVLLRRRPPPCRPCEIEVPGTPGEAASTVAADLGAPGRLAVRFDGRTTVADALRQLDALATDRSGAPRARFTEITALGER